MLNPITKSASLTSNKKTFRLSLEALGYLRKIGQALPRVSTTKGLLELAVKDCLEVMVPKLFAAAMNANLDDDPVGQVVSMYIGGSGALRQEYSEIVSGGRSVKGKTFAISSDTAAAIAILEDRFKLNQSKTLELVLFIYHRKLERSLAREILELDPICSAVVTKIKKMVDYLNEIESDLDESIQQLIKVSPFSYFALRYPELKTIHQPLGAIHLYDDEAALYHGLDGMEKGLLNFLAIKRIAEDALRDCQSSRDTLDRQIEEYNKGLLGATARNDYI